MGNASGPWYIRFAWPLVALSVSLHLSFAIQAVLDGQSVTQAFIVDFLGPPVLTFMALRPFVSMLRLPGQPGHAGLAFGPLLALGIVAMLVFHNLLFGALIELPALAGVL